MNNLNGTYKHDPRTFSGYVYGYDYEHYTSMSDVAGRILSDMKFDKEMKQIAENNKRKKGINKNAKA